jgi:hypothetical protein
MMRLHEIENIDEAPLDFFKRGTAAAKAFMQTPQANAPAQSAAASQAASKGLKKGTKDSGYTYDDQTRTWTHPTKGKARGMLNRQLMNKYGANDSGEPLKPSVGQKISQKLGGPFAQGLDPKAGIAQKIGAKIGSALGRGVAALVRPKDTDGDGQPDAEPAGQEPAQAQAAPQAPKSGSGDTRQGVVQVDQNLGNIVNQMRSYQPKPGAKPLPAQKAQGVAKDIAQVRNNKDWAVMTGSKILKFANAGYDVTALHKQWSQEVAIGKKQKIMQDQFSEELDLIKKLAGI